MVAFAQSAGKSIGDFASLMSYLIRVLSQDSGNG